MQWSGRIEFLHGMTRGAIPHPFYGCLYPNLALSQSHRGNIFRVSCLSIDSEQEHLCM